MRILRSIPPIPLASGVVTTVFGALFVAVTIGCQSARSTTTPPSAARTAPGSPAPDWKAVDAAMGRPGVAQPGDVQRYNFPRGDLHVVVSDQSGDVTLRPTMALGGWIAMHGTGAGNSVMAMGDIVLTESELPAVMSRLQQGGVEQTAVHHHVMRETPRVLYMHVSAHGDAVKIAETVRSAIALTNAPATTPAPSSSAAAPGIDLDTSSVATALGYTGRTNGGVYQVSTPRPETIRERGMVVPGSMGLGTAMNFQPTGGGRAAITGDFVLLATEVNPVIRALRGAGIEVTSLHNHMLNDEPRLFFMHFWAIGDAVVLARGLRSALDSTAQRAR
ncbi:DUF1259 domain-containing protein [Gemmatimonas sp.]|uniref:DUF1259 domain-containing protein n=1 Tax=Gemmatimonas sp. TaxID=1962908 RepID=UPI0035619CE2